MEEFMKQPCKHCPFRSDVKPFLHPNRAYQIAIASQNPYNTFPCHKTTVPDEESDDGTMISTNESKECAGFLTLRANAGEDVPKGFEPSFETCYEDADDMYQAYEEQWNKKN